MSGPWDDFAQTASADDGPWAAFAPKAAPKAAPSASPPAKRAVFDPIGDVVGATNSFLAGIQADKQQFDARGSKQPANLIDAAKDTLGAQGRMLGHVADAVAIPFAPITGTLQRGIADPYGEVMSHALPKTNKQEWANSMMTALSAAGPETGPTGMAKVPLGPPRPPPPNAFASTVQRFDRAGVSPMAATAGDRGAATVTNVVAENPIAGAAVRGRLRNSMQQTDAAAQRIAGQYGETRGPQITGENIQQGVERFANSRDVPAAPQTAPASASSFSAKSSQLYDDVFGKLDGAMTGKTNPAQTVEVFGAGEGPTRVQVGGSQIKTPATSAVLGDITNGGQSRAINSLITDPTVAKAANAITDANAAKDMSFDDLRRVRTWVRTAQKNPELRASIGDANLGRLEGALTQDIYQNADALGSPQLSHQLRRTDQYYAAGQQRIQAALQPFADAKSGEGAYSRLVQAAGSGASADAQKLLSLKRSVSPSEWGDVAANVISELGKQTAGNAPAGQPGFSVSSFVTNYNKLSDRGRSVLFDSLGGGGKGASNLRAELDNLATVADDLKTVEKGANTSKSFVNAQTAATGAGLLTPHTMIPTAGLLAGMGLTGEMLTNPVVVRWLARTAKAAKQGPAPLQNTVKQLGMAARANVALLPLHRQAVLMLEAPKVATPLAAQDQPPEDQ